MQESISFYTNGFLFLYVIRYTIYYMILEPKKIIPLLGIQHGMNVLDIGSSIGFWAKPLSEIVGNAGKIFALDNHPESIQRLHNDLTEMGITNIYPMTVDIHGSESLGIQTGICDKILFVRMMNVIEDRTESIMVMLSEYLRDHGEIIIIDSVDYFKDVEKFLKLHDTIYSSEPIPLILERTDNHYFGFRISKASI